MSAPRTEHEVAADTVVLLLAAKLITLRDTTTPETLASAARVPVSALAAAQERYVARRMAPPQPTKAAKSSPKTPTDRAEKSRALKAMTTAERHDHWLKQTPRLNKDGLLRCTGLDAQSHYAPLDHFNRRSDRPWALKPTCIECLANYQRARHLKIAQQEQLSDAGIAIQLVAGDPTFICSECTLPIGPGDKAHITGVIAHASCLAMDEAH